MSIDKKKHNNDNSNNAFFVSYNHKTWSPRLQIDRPIFDRHPKEKTVLCIENILQKQIFYIFFLLSIFFCSYYVPCFIQDNSKKCISRKMMLQNIVPLEFFFSSTRFSFLFIIATPMLLICLLQKEIGDWDLIWIFETPLFCHRKQ